MIHELIFTPIAIVPLQNGQYKLVCSTEQATELHTMLSSVVDNPKATPEQRMYFYDVEGYMGPESECIKLWNKDKVAS